MLATKCFVYLCITFCQDLVANFDGGYRYSEPYPKYIDEQCIEKEKQKQVNGPVS